MSTKHDAQRVQDLQAAIETIGRILADESLTPQKRIARAQGICFMYDTPKERQA